MGRCGSFGAYTVLFTLISKLFTSKKITNSLALFSGISNLAAMGCLLVFKVYPSPINEVFILAIQILRGIGTVGLMLLWALWFASLSKKKAGAMVAPTALLAIIVFFFAMAIVAVFDVGIYIYPLFLTISAACFLLSRFRLEKHNRKLKKGSAKGMAIFYLSRAFLGFAIGISTQFLQVNEIFTPSLLLIVVGIIIVSIILFWFRRSRSDPFRILPLIPILAAGLMLLPCLPGHQSSAFAACATALTWFCWIVFSSFQISQLKETFGLNEAFITFSEKMVVMIFLLLGSIVSSGLIPMIDSGQLGMAMDYFSICLVYIMVLAASAIMWDLVYTRRQAEFIEELSKPQRERLKALYDEIAHEYRLSSREREVLEMLAEGHTLKYIQDSLVISIGTAKAHTSHVYQKLGVHKKEELYSFVVDYGERGRIPLANESRLHPIDS